MLEVVCMIEGDCPVVIGRDALFGWSLKSSDCVPNF